MPCPSFTFSSTLTFSSECSDDAVSDSLVRFWETSTLHYLPLVLKQQFHSLKGGLYCLESDGRSATQHKVLSNAQLLPLATHDAKGAAYETGIRPPIQICLHSDTGAQYLQLQGKLMCTNIKFKSWSIEACNRHSMINRNWSQIDPQATPPKTTLL